MSSEVRLCDYSFSRPPIAGIKHSGYVAAIRYLANDGGEGSSKILRSTEAKALHMAGLAIALVWETTANRTAEGYAAGQSDRVVAERMAKALGYPKECPIFIAVDFDANPDVVLPYFSGWFNANQFAAGPYGSLRVCDAVLAHHPKAYVWQTAAWSYNKLSPHADVYQRVGHKAPAVAGGGYDEDVLCKPVPFWGPKGAVVLSPHGVKQKPKKPPKPSKPKTPKSVSVKGLSKPHVSLIQQARDYFRKLDKKADK